MNIKFKKVILHNFTSYKDAEIDLEDRGYCAISGENRCKKDNAKSNGSGKSAIVSAICYALTGETIQGIKNNLKNVNVPENDCWVKLIFEVNGILYELTRKHSPRTLLTIIRDGVDISGKGIKESEAQLAYYLPDLNKELVSGIILLGQGLPNKFSAFSPSGRKEYLEKLAKSDYMLDDIKTRVTNRLDELNKMLRVIEDCLLAKQTTQNLKQAELYNITDRLKNFVFKDYTVIISKSEATIEGYAKELTGYEKELVAQEAAYKAIVAELLSLTTQKATEEKEELTSYMVAVNNIRLKKQPIEVALNVVAADIKAKKAIKDICPTCGQKLPNIQKPDTTELEKELANLKEQLVVLQQQEVTCEEQHKKYLEKIASMFSEEFAKKKAVEKAIESKLSLIKQSQQQAKFYLEQEKINLEKAKVLASTERTDFEALTNEKLALESFLAKIATELTEMSRNKLELDAKLAIDKKVETLVKRDFRGHLLVNVIGYLNKKAKEYCNIVFKTTAIDLFLDGNSLSVSYDNKPLESLSGGEQTRIDLILQLAIRSMLQKYSNFSSNIIVLDECTDFLDQKSARAVMELLEHELSTVESIFIISHHAESLQLQIDSELKVVKDESGISRIN